MIRGQATGGLKKAQLIISQKGVPCGKKKGLDREEPREDLVREN